MDFSCTMYVFFFIVIVVSQYLVFQLSWTGDENADNEIRGFAVVS